MANVRDKTQTTSSPATTQSAAGDAPQVQVYDTNGTSNVDRATTSYSTTTTPATRGTVEPVRSGINWGAIILGILIVAALVWLIMWLL
jgi:hypothetical protein